jgi:hypothetical protein
MSVIPALVIEQQTAISGEQFPARTKNSAATLPHNLTIGSIDRLLSFIMALLKQQSADSTTGPRYPLFWGLGK